MESPHGVIVTRRAAGAPAEKARLEAGDVRRPSPPPRGQALARRPTLPSKRFSLAPRRTINLISVPFAARSASKPALFSNSTRSRLTMPSQAPAVIFVPMGRTLTSSAGTRAIQAARGLPILMKRGAAWVPSATTMRSSPRVPSLPRNNQPNWPAQRPNLSCAMPSLDLDST